MLYMRRMILKLPYSLDDRKEKTGDRLAIAVANVSATQVLPNLG
jgi:hypothetical protein